ncbi:MAG: HDIG domain-containing protein, partial [Pirellulales bacterium]|nr:HDIG domain-containing protein [Pirellulales bacterium]
FLAAVAMCVAIRGWDPPFAYRENYTPPRDIDARYAFEVLDPLATRMARSRARQQAMIVFANDAEPLVQLRASLRNTLLEIAAHEYSELDASVWPKFELPPDKGAKPADETQKKKEFDEFRKQVSGEKQSALVEAAVAEALAPYEKSGLLEKNPEQEGNQEEILVYPLDDPLATATVPLASVLVGDATDIHDALKRDLVKPMLADRLFVWIRPELKSTLRVDAERTKQQSDKAAAAVANQVKTYDVGEILVRAGQPIKPEQINLLRREYSAMLAQLSIAPKIYRAVAVLAVIVVVFSLCGLYLVRRERLLLASIKRLVVMLALLVLTVSLARLVSFDPWRAELLPVLLFGQMTAIAYRQELALLLSGAVSLILVMGLGMGIGEFIMLFGVTAAAVLQVGHIRSRSRLISIGFFSALVAVLLTIVAAVTTSQPLSWTLLQEALRNAAWTLAAGFIMTGLLPFIERLFGVLTDMSLLELGDVAHPLLQELVRRAPSTYNHSITMGSVAEAAADAIGARGLLVRVGAYYHDIGKMLKPGYFIENQGENEENRLETLVPAMSTLVIIAHIKDGAKLARQHHLPEPIIDFIQQHHGTTLVGYFYERARGQSKDDPHGGSVEESSYRYPGPKPQTKEAAVMMLADAVESASRTLVDPTPARIESLVRQISERRLDDGQFDESGLTLRELRTIEKSMVKSVTAIYHGRVKYPDQKGSENGNGKGENGKRKGDNGKHRIDAPEKTRSKEDEDAAIENGDAGEDKDKKAEDKG